MRNLRIAFRNLSRQKKRSFLLGGAIAFGVLIITLVNSFTAGLVENIQEILSVPGLDIAFIGPYDLSQSLGVTGQVDDPRVTQAMRAVVEECRKRNVAVGTFVDTLEEARKWSKAGVRYLCYSVDVGLFTEKCQETIRSLRDSSN